jgi:hypothetical protein
MSTKKIEVITTCEKCGKKEARVEKVMLDEQDEVYNMRWWIPILIMAGIGIVAYPYIPAALQIPGGILLAVAGVVYAKKVIQQRKRIVQGKEIYCHACYHFWWEKEVNGRTVKIYAREGKKRTTNY